MFLTQGLAVNEKGHLTIGGCDTTELAAAYGTPLYVMDEQVIRDALKEYVRSMKEFYPQGGRIAYASKACCFLEMYRIAGEEGAGADVASAGELYTALQAGFPADRLYFHGNNKPAGELRMALEAGVGRIVVDNLPELHRLSAVARELGCTADILLRVTPGIDAHTHSFIRTGQIDSKFGLTMENGDALAAVREAAAMKEISLRGIHCHIGSQIFDAEPFIHAAEVLLDFLSDVRTQTGLAMKEMSLGGGFGIAYTAEDQPRPYSEYMAMVSGALKKKAEALDYPLPFIILEPGRSIAAPAGITLYTVGGVKNIPGVRTYISVDGGMADNPRYALYQAEYTVAAASRMNDPVACQATIAGRCCESGDMLQENVSLPDMDSGDLLAVLATGAYNYSMSSNYNRLPRPAVVMVKNGESRVVVRGETYDDLIRNDI
ncbi:MAG: diaminopimelate decarboxylase [Clostridiales bacterium]|nr:diaminopimelate decarboxylase [Clostridiales bacterium]